MQREVHVKKAYYFLDHINVLGIGGSVHKKPLGTTLPVLGNTFVHAAALSYSTFPHFTVSNNATTDGKSPPICHYFFRHLILSTEPCWLAENYTFNFAKMNHHHWQLQRTSYDST